MDVIAFARGVPAPEMLPVDRLRDAARRAFDTDPVKLLSYGTGAGWEPLRARLAARHGVSTSRVVVTTGSLQGFALLAQVLQARATAAGRRARIVVEQPTYDRPLLLLERLGVEIVPVPQNEDGIDVDAFEAAAQAGADLAYVIPTFQNPSGATLPLAARQRLVDIAASSGIPILEDDPYGLLHFDEPAPTPMFELAHGSDLAMFSGSFSKTIAPGLRVGWLVLPEELAADVATLANDTYISASFLGQATVDAFLEDGSLEPTIERSRSQLAERCRTLVSALDTHLPGSSFHAPGGGYFLWARLPHGVRGADVASAGIEHGVSLVAGSSFGAGCEDHVRLAFSSPPIDQIDLGVQRLAAACAAVRAHAHA